MNFPFTARGTAHVTTNWTLFYFILLLCLILGGSGSGEAAGRDSKKKTGGSTNTKPEPRIPRVATVFHGFSDSNDASFDLVNYASIVSARLFFVDATADQDPGHSNAPSLELRLYVPDSGPQGTLWDKAAPHVNKIVSVPTWNSRWDAQTRARKLLALKLAVLHRDGGLVMDSDVVLTGKKLQDVLEEGFVVGDDAGTGYPTSILLSAKSSAVALDWSNLLKDRPKDDLPLIARSLFRVRRPDLKILPPSTLVWPETTDHNGLVSLYFGRGWKTTEHYAVKTWENEVGKLGFPVPTIPRTSRMPGSLNCLLRSLMANDPHGSSTTSGGDVNCDDSPGERTPKDGPFLGGYWSSAPESASNAGTGTFVLSGGSLGRLAGGLEAATVTKNGLINFDGTSSFGFIPLDNLGLGTGSFAVVARFKIPYGVEENRDILSLETSNSFVSLTTAYKDATLHIILKSTGKIPIPPLFQTLDTRWGTGQAQLENDKLHTVVFTLDSKTNSAGLSVDGTRVSEASLVREEPIQGLWLATQSAVILDDSHKPFPKLRYTLSDLALFDRAPFEAWLDGRLFAAPLSPQELEVIHALDPPNWNDLDRSGGRLVAELTVTPGGAVTKDILERKDLMVPAFANDCVVDSPQEGGKCFRLEIGSTKHSSKAPISFDEFTVEAQFDRTKHSDLHLLALSINFVPRRRLVASLEPLEAGRTKVSLKLFDLGSQTETIHQGELSSPATPLSSSLSKHHRITLTFAREQSSATLFLDGIKATCFKVAFDLVVSSVEMGMPAKTRSEGKVKLSLWSYAVGFAEVWGAAGTVPNDISGSILTAKRQLTQRLEGPKSFGPELLLDDDSTTLEFFVPIGHGTLSEPTILSDDTSIVYVASVDVSRNSSGTLFTIRHGCWTKGKTHVRFATLDGGVRMTWTKVCREAEERASLAVLKEVVTPKPGSTRNNKPHTRRAQQSPSSWTFFGTVKRLFLWSLAMVVLDIVRGTLVRHRVLKRGIRFYQRTEIQRIFVAILAGYLVLRYEGVPTASRGPVRPLPFISVIVPCHNQVQYLHDALNSVIAQTYDNWEMVIVDDGSTDRCHAAAEAFKARFPSFRIRAYTKPNGGLSSARNFGISHSVGEFICALDADDYLHPTYLERVAHVIAQDPSIGMVYANQQFVYESDWKWYTPDYSRDGTLYQGQFPVNTVYRRTDWELVGGYTEVLPWGNEDWNMWISLTGLRPDFRVHRIPDFLLFYRYKAKSMQRDMGRFTEVVPMLRTMHPNAYPVSEMADYHQTIVQQMTLPTLANLEEKLVSHPDSFMLHLWIGMYWEGVGQKDKAESHYVLAMDSTAPAEVKWQIIYRRAIVSGDKKKRREFCARAIELKPGLKKIRPNLRCN